MFDVLVRVQTSTTYRTPGQPWYATGDRGLTPRLTAPRTLKLTWYTKYYNILVLHQGDTEQGISSGLFPRSWAGFGIIPWSRDKCEVPLPHKPVPRRIDIHPVPALTRPAKVKMYSETRECIEESEVPLTSTR